MMGGRLWRQQNPSTATRSPLLFLLMLLGWLSFLLLVLQPQSAASNASVFTSSVRSETLLAADDIEQQPKRSKQICHQ